MFAQSHRENLQKNRKKSSIKSKFEGFGEKGEGKGEVGLYL
jgi:hypothetical protein